ncbi:MAG: hypothetical protein ACJAYC_002107 [Halieaceae bacterium]
MRRGSVVNCLSAEVPLGDLIIEFDRTRKDAITRKILQYFQRELDHEIGQFEAEFLLDFFAHEIGAEFYNQGLTDAQTVLSSRMDDIQDAISEIEKPVPL